MAGGAMAVQETDVKTPDAPQATVPVTADIVCTELVSGTGKSEKVIRDCYIPEGKFDEIKKRAVAMLSRGIRGAYSEFPISKGLFFSKIEKAFLTEEAVRGAFERTGGITEANHNKMRKHFRSSEWDDDADDDGTPESRGLFAKRIDVGVSCPEGYDFENSPYYWEVDKCSDVEKLLKGGIPATMYSLPMPSKKAQAYVVNPENARYVTAYTDNTPESCTSEYASAGEKVARYAISIMGIIDLDFIVAGYDHGGVSYWKMLRSCTSDGGKKLEWDDLKFDFGYRVFVPVTVQINDHIEEQSLMFSSVAAAGNMGIGISPEAAYLRYLGAEFAKKILVTAKHAGWKIEK